MGYLRSILLAAAAGLAGCATGQLSEEECLAGDWEAIGLEDGLDGETVERLAEHRERCAKFDVEPDEATWMRARAAGLETLCTFDNGVAFGLSGGDYKGVCPAEAEPEFLEGYGPAATVSDLRARVGKYESEVQRYEYQISSYPSDARRLAEKANSAENAEERDKYRKRLDSLRSSVDTARMLVGSSRINLERTRTELLIAERRLDDARAARSAAAATPRPLEEAAGGPALVAAQRFAASTGAYAGCGVAEDGRIDCIAGAGAATIATGTVEACASGAGVATSDSFEPFDGETPGARQRFVFTPKDADAPTGGFVVEYTRDGADPDVASVVCAPPV